MKQKIKRGLILGSAIAAMTGPVLADGQKASVMHWWTSGSEAQALHVMAEAYNAAGGEWVDNAVPDFESAVAAATSAIISGNAPTALQFNAGSQIYDLAGQGYLTDLTPMAEAGNWQAVLPAAIYKGITVEDKVYAVPVVNHGSSWLWISQPALAKAGVTLPDSWAGFIPMLEKIKAAGIIPLAHGGEAWQELEFLSNVLLFSGRDDLYKAVFVTGDLDVIRSDDFKAFADEFKSLSNFIDPGAPGRKWNDATAMVVNGTAAMQFMGDWAKAEFTAAGQVPGKDFDCVLGFGGHDRFLIGVDVFVFPKNKNDEAGPARELLVNTMMDPKVQVAFNVKKGGLPTRLDADVTPLDMCAQRGYAAMQKAEQQVEIYSLTTTGDREGALQDATSTFWNTPGMTGAEFSDLVVQAIEATEY